MIWTSIFDSLPLVVIWLALGAVGIALQALVKSSKVVYGYYLWTLIATAVMAVWTMPKTGMAFDGMIITGGYGSFFDVLFCVGGILTMFAARPYLERESAEFDEFYTLLVSAVSGMMFIAHSANMLVTFVGIELMSVSFYVMAGFFRQNIRSVESALKYFLLGAFATGFLVYGMALIYGATNSLSFSAIGQAVIMDTVQFPVLLAIGSALLVIGLLFKVAAFPFHQWAPDVYQGAPTVVSAFMSTAGKAAAFAALMPIAAAVIPPGHFTLYGPAIQQTLAVIAAATMLVGNITAITQTNVKRMLAYSSVAHAGYLLMGIVAGTPQGHYGIVFYLTAYTFMQIGAFIVVSVLETPGDGHLEFDDYNGLARRRPVLATLMAVFMFSLTGIPPMAGFFGKYLLFTAALDAGYVWLVIVAALSSVISAWFYLGLIIRMFFREPADETTQAPAGTAAITLAISTVMILLLGFAPSLLINVFKTW
jgi:NADH-quinone oxidoreductase subunit N